MSPSPVNGTCFGYRHNVGSNPATPTRLQVDFDAAIRRGLLGWHWKGKKKKMTSYLIEVIERVSGKSLGFTRLNLGGGRSCVEAHEATWMTLAEAWLVMKEIERDLTVGCDYRVPSIGV